MVVALNGQSKRQQCSQSPTMSSLTEKQCKVEFEPRVSGSKHSFTSERNLSLIIISILILLQWLLQLRLVRTLIFLKHCPLQVVLFRGYLGSSRWSLGNSFNAFCVVTSITSSTETPFTWAIYSAEMEMFRGSFRTWNRKKRHGIKRDRSNPWRLWIKEMKMSRLKQLLGSLLFFFLKGLGRRPWTSAWKLRLQHWWSLCCSWNIGLTKP